MPAVAITDTGNLFGALEFAIACTDAGMQPIIGIEIALAPARPGAASAPRPVNGHAAEPDRIVLLAQNETGYRNLMRAGEPRLSRRRGRGRADRDAGRSRRGERGPDLPRGRRRRADRAPACRGPVRCRRSGAARPENGFSRAASTSSCSVTACPKRRAARPGLSISPMRTTCRSSRPTTPIFPDRDFYEAHDALMCIAQGRVVADTGPQAADAASLLPAGRRDARAVRRSAGGLRQHARHRPALRLYPAAAQADPAGL